MVETLVKYPKTVSQTTGGKFRDFSNLGNIKNSTSGSWATSNGNIRSKSGSPNRPSTVTATNFAFSLPTGAEVTSVEVTLRHKKNKVGNHTCNIPAPTLSLVGVTGIASKKAHAPTVSDMVTKTFKFTGSALTRTVVNSSNFGVKVDYPANTSSYEGTVSISYLRVTVNYKKSQYSVNMKKASGGYNQDPYVIQANISNKNLTSYNPTLTLTAPQGFSFKDGYSTASDKQYNDSVTKVNERTITWNPHLSKSVGTATAMLTFDVDVTLPASGTWTGDFVIVESLYSTSKIHTATITQKPAKEEEETEPDQEIVDVETKDQYRYNHVVVGEEFDFIFTLTDEEYNHIFDGIIDTLFLNGSNFQVYMGSTFGWQDAVNVGFSTIAFDENHSLSRKLRAKDVEDPSEIEFYWIDSNLEHHSVCTFVFDVMPEEEDLTIPFLSLLELGSEELDRLGTGFTYIFECNLKHTTEDEYVRDWYKNNRIGVFNNVISDNVTVEEIVDPETGEITEVITDTTDYDNLTPDEIFTYAEYWSDGLSSVNEYNNIECEFIYNKNYPLYLIFVGDYVEATNYDFDVGEICFTDPCIIEKSNYNGRESSGRFPIPIKDLINYEDSDDTATITLDGYQDSNNVVLYDFPLSEGYGTGEDLAIRGVQVRATLESTDEIVVYAKLKNPKGEIGQRSQVLEDLNAIVDSSYEFVIGGLGDLWGFNTLDMVDLGDWELELGVSNLLSGEESTLNFADVKLVFFVEDLEDQQVIVKVEGEDLRYYGAFVEDVNIPEGLETDTDFLSIDGTDTNDAYRQNIREKTITLEFSIHECDLQTSTDLLRQLGKLLQNEKDQYNRPITKTLEFSHYPNDYFEYIMTDPLDITSEVSGYTVKAKLVIPAGTSYSKEDSVTNTIGYVQGLAAINPIITLKPSGETVQVRETISGQVFNIGYTGDWNDQVVEVDCEDRKVYLESDEDADDRVDISRYVDQNSDWFRLFGEYNFEGSNCVIRTVKYNERW